MVGKVCPKMNISCCCNGIGSNIRLDSFKFDQLTVSDHWIGWNEPSIMIIFSNHVAYGIFRYYIILMGLIL